MSRGCYSMIDEKSYDTHLNRIIVLYCVIDTYSGLASWCNVVSGDCAASFVSKHCNVCS